MDLKTYALEIFSTVKAILLTLRGDAGGVQTMLQQRKKQYNIITFVTIAIPLSTIQLFSKGS